MIPASRNTWEMRDGKLVPAAAPDFIPGEGEYDLIVLLLEAGFDTDRRLIMGRGVFNDTIVLEGREKCPGGYTYVILISPMNSQVYMIFLRDFGEFVEAINHLDGLLRLNFVQPPLGATDEGCSGCSGCDDDDDDTDWYPSQIKPSEN